ncbi:hypothetical protein [Aureispira anguillae]|uniref:Uncharacterized protein n=1 Tax=Aureispira anguillae TaxID=2864201 RepID=A0A915YFF2_9BACT|nr:hypothetical protein [Aureispira anguillae]BDS12003.1 hypothetical protein AsAng_0027180 [Aureispira anguillae]
MDLHDLLEQKAFQDLDQEERAFVLEQMTKEDYDTERMAILESQAFFVIDEQKIQANAAPNKALLALRNKQQKKPMIWTVLLAYKIPAWQAVAATLLVFFLAQHLGTNRSKDAAILAHQNLIDTVFVDKYITQIKEVVQPSDTIIKVVYKVLDREPDTLDAKVLANTSIERTGPIARLERGGMDANEMDQVLQYCSNASSEPISKDTFLQGLSNNIIF